MEKANIYLHLNEGGKTTIVYCRLMSYSDENPVVICLNSRNRNAPAVSADFNMPRQEMTFIPDGTWVGIIVSLEAEVQISVIHF